jgi:hypothetical protein
MGSLEREFADMFQVSGPFPHPCMPVSDTLA